MPDRECKPEADQPKPPAQSAGETDDAQSPTEASKAAQSPAEASEAAQAPDKASDDAQAPDEASDNAQSPAKPSEAAQAPEPSSQGSRKKRRGKQRKGVKRKAKQQEDDPGEDEPRKDELRQDKQPKDEPREDEPRKGRRPEGKQRKHRERKDQQRATRRDRLDAAGNERPRFLLSFPEDPQLERLIEAFERGDHALVRREARRVAKRARDPEVRAAARELRRRIDPDPLAVYLLLAAVALLLFLIVWAYHAQ